MGGVGGTVPSERPCLEKRGRLTDVLSRHMVGWWGACDGMWFKSIVRILCVLKTPAAMCRYTSRGLPRAGGLAVRWRVLI